MGDPRRLKKKYSGPRHPWEGKRINEEKGLISSYGLKNKTEIWKASSFLRKIKSQTKLLIALTTEQSKKEEQQLLKRLQRLNLLDKSSKIEDILNLQLNNILDRRLQTQVFKLGLARTPNQARQFITHVHIFIQDHRISVPSYLVPVEEETLITFSPSSKLRSEDHPERAIQKKEKSKEVKVKKKVTDKSETSEKKVTKAPKEKVKSQNIEKENKKIIKEEKAKK